MTVTFTNPSLQAPIGLVLHRLGLIPLTSRLDASRLQLYSYCRSGASLDAIRSRRRPRCMDGSFCIFLHALKSFLFFTAGLVSTMLLVIPSRIVHPVASPDSYAHHSAVPSHCFHLSGLLSAARSREQCAFFYLVICRHDRSEA